jgi:hypothetical protein
MVSVITVWKFVHIFIDLLKINTRLNRNVNMAVYFRILSINLKISRTTPNTKYLRKSVYLSNNVFP